MERYESLGPVGEGSYGTVLKCRHRDSGRLVAIKKFMDSDDDKTVKKIALREIKLLRQLRHDNLVNLLEVWKRRRRWYLVFEFVERTLLDDLEQSPGGLDLNTSRQYLYQILRAAAFCHKQNIIHRDIKPENILISQGGVVKLCDFGFARTMASPSEGAVYTDYVATRWYRAPELLVGDIKYGKPVDVWAVGCLLIEMLTGQPLFPGDSDLDQIYHIVRCFGNLTSHHQELFYRNPIFSGVRLPECSGRVMLQQRFPTITSTALDLAQSCLEMDPEKRAQCSELLEHPLFTQDSFHIRFLDELNAKIQKDHRENSTLPKITKTENNPKQEKDDEKNRRGKDKKHPEDADEKVGKEKLEKNKGKQQLKVSKTVSNKSEPLMTTKQPKTLGNKVVYNAAQPSMQMKSKPGKNTGVELLSKSTKILHLHSSEGTKTAVSLKDDNTEEAIPKHERVVSLEPRDEYLDHAKDIEHNGSELWRLSKSEQSQDCGNNTNTIMSSSPDASIDRTDRHYSSSNNHVDVIVPTFISKPSKSSNTSEPQTHSLTAESQQRTGECPKVLSADHKLSKTLSTSHPITNKSNLCSSATPSKIISAQSSTLSIEVTPANSTMTVAEEISDPKLSKVGSPSKGRPKDLIEVAEDEHIKDSHICLRMSPETKMALHHVQTSQASGEHDKMNLESSEPRCLHQESPTRSKIATEARTTSVQKENTSVGNPNLKTLKVSDKENRQDLALFVPISATAKSSVNQTSKKASGNDIKSSNFESGVKFVKAVHPKSLAGEPKSKPEYYYTRSTTTPRTQRTTFPADTRKKSDNPEKNDTTKVSMLIPDDKASSKSSVSEFDCRIFSTSPPPPPPPPSSTPLLTPPSFGSLTHPFSGVGTDSPTPNGHITLGAGVHPGTNNLRHVEKPRHHGGLHSQQARQFLSSHISGPLTFQAPEKSPIRERSFLSDHCNLGNSASVATDKNKSHIHLPDLRSSALPELRGREGKHNKASTKDQRKDKHPVSTSRPSESQLHGHNSTDA